MTGRPSYDQLMLRPGAAPTVLFTTESEVFNGKPRGTEPMVIVESINTCCKRGERSRHGFRSVRVGQGLSGTGAHFSGHPAF